MSLPQYDKRELLQMALDNRLIKSLDYNTFEGISDIGKGAFGTVKQAYSRSLRKKVALKSITDENYELFFKELTNILAVNNNDNIIKFFGISIEPLTNKYLLVLQYANDGDLRIYLRKNFEKLNWEKKINMAKDIALGLYFIHESNIVHRDLHSKNILVNEGRLLIADLGLSQPLDSNSNSVNGGMFAYTDPGYLRDTKYKRDKCSDIYSLGVLFWELSSGKPPFKDFHGLDILEKIRLGDRETPINGTPLDYIKIYESAWSDDPNQRPDVERILNILENIKLENVHYNHNNDQLQKYQPRPDMYDDGDGDMSLSSTSINTQSKECAETLDKIREQFKFISDFTHYAHSPICEAHLHVVLGDFKGLQWHLKDSSNKNDDYGPPFGTKRNLYEFAIKYCNKEDIMNVFQALNRFYPYSQTKLNLDIQLLFSNNKIRIPQDLRDIMKLIIDSNYDINCKKKNENSFALYNLLQSIDNNIYDIIEIYLENGFDSNNPFNDTLPNLLFFAVYKDYPNKIIELIFKHPIDLLKRNKDGSNILGYTATTENFKIKVDSLIKIFIKRKEELSN
ncbi:hypothetical protein Glove_208g207 [Diversispora epigaea]|uniref:Protein kinase domain-containing protein n=1 Tax=Diversispora epigaea TaxID=1348612 RepID=A0A397IJ85_9GLOM|nr:hypothetical protein Glove_208g207 [Diversispora epigaea]